MTTLPVPSGHLTIRLADGVRLHVESYGPRRAAATVVLLHGWTLDRRVWHRQVSALTALPDPPRVVAYDARGHGRSSPTDRLAATLPQLGDDLAAVLAHIDGPVVLVGHSLGGMTIMEYAAENPRDFAARVRGLVMVSTTAEGHTHTGYGLPHPLSRIVRVLELSGSYVMARCGDLRPHRPLINALRPAIRWLMFGEPCDPADLQLACAAVAGSSLRSIGGFRESVGTQQRLETLRALPSLPAAVLVGDLDRITPLPCAEGIADALGATGLHVLPDAGHMLMMERAAEVNAAIHAVLDAAATPLPRAA